MKTKTNIATESHDAVRARYDEWSNWYPYIYGSLEQGLHYFHSTIAGTLKKYLGQGKVLDIGCGVGLSTGGLARAGYHVTGFDLSGRSVERARELLSEYSNVSVSNSDIFDFEPEEQWDAAVAASGFLEHFLSTHEQLSAIEKIISTVRPGGYVLIDCYDQEALMQLEPDEVIRHVGTCESDLDRFVFLEKRTWHGSPRTKRYDVTYFQVRDDDKTTSLSVKGLAVTLKDMEYYFRKAGIQYFRWVLPASSGYHKHIGIAKVPDAKAPVSTLKENDHTSDVFIPKPIVMPGDQASEQEASEIVHPENLPPNPFEEKPNYQQQSLGTYVSKDGHQIIERYRQVTLVMLSGGVDSVYTLLKLLRSSKDEIIAHHINFVNLEGRTKAEAQACDKIVDYLKRKERDFFYTESLIDRRRFRAFGGDDMAVSFEVGIIAQSYMRDCNRPIDRWTAGICMEEELEDHNFLDEIKMEHMLNATAAACFPSDPPRFFQLEIIPKKDQMTYMGPELVDMCWTCRRPRQDKNMEWLECGECKTCLLMGKIRRGEVTLPSKPKAI